MTGNYFKYDPKPVEVKKTKSTPNLEIWLVTIGIMILVTIIKIWR